MSKTSIPHNPLCSFCLPIVLKALTKLASRPRSVLPCSLLVLTADVNNDCYTKQRVLGYYVGGGWRVA